MNDNEKKELILKLNREVAKLLNKPIAKVVPIVDKVFLRECGSFNLVTNELTLNSLLINYDEIIDTILHELCHAYDSTKSGHGKEWKLLALKVGKAYGTSITRCTSKMTVDEKIASKKAIAKMTCNGCGIVYYIYRKCSTYYREGQDYSHRNCPLDKGDNSKFKFEYLNKGGKDNENYFNEER